MHFLFLYYISILYAFYFFFFFNDTATTEIYTLSLHDALPISSWRCSPCDRTPAIREAASASPTRCSARSARSEEHTSELQSHVNLVCRLLLEKKKKKRNIIKNKKKKKQKKKK